MKPVKIVLPWPEKNLWPNTRVLWPARYKARWTAKSEAFVTMKHSRVKFPADVLLWFVFHPPHRRRYDVDNAIAACKGYLDGMAEASGVDDSVWTDFRLSKGVRTDSGAVCVIACERDFDGLMEFGEATLDV